MELEAQAFTVGVPGNPHVPHAWYSRGRWRQAFERAISMRGQALPPPGCLQAAALQPNRTASLHMSMIISRHTLCS
eukprot:2509878-Pyramimonas_sp.AAC.1